MTTNSPIMGSEGWWLSLSAWIIHEGIQGELTRGGQAELAVEFSMAEPEVRRGDAKASARHREGTSYDLVARVAAVESDLWVVDAGLLMYCEGKAPAGVAVGDVVEGSANIGVDPFFFVEKLAGRASLPALVYTWSVDTVLRQVAPLVMMPGRGLVYDPTKAGWDEVAATKARPPAHCDSYLLRCSRLAVPPKRTSKTAMPRTETDLTLS